MPFEIFGKIHLDGSSIASGLTRGVGRQLSAFGNSLKGQVAAAFGTAALINHVRKTVDFASQMVDLSDATGIAVERLQELDFAAKQNGTTIDALVRATRALAQARADALANPGGKEARAFGLFGMDMETLRGTSDPSVLMDRLSRAVKGAKFDLNSLPQILELVGQKNLEVLPALIAGLEDSAVTARRMGQVMEETVARQLDNLGDRVEALQKRLTVGLGPALLKVGELGLEAFSGLAIGFEGAKAFVESLISSKRVMFKDAFKDASDAARAATMSAFVEKALEQQGVEDAQKKTTLRTLLPGFDDLEALFTGKGTRTREGRGGGGDGLVTDSLARIGGFGHGAENRTISLLERTAAGVEETARNTAGGTDLI